MSMTNDFKHLDNGVTVIHATEYKGMLPYDVLISTIQFGRINENSKRIYIGRTVDRIGGGKKPYAIMIRKYGNEIRLHKYILEIPKGDKRHVHHIDGDSLNNCDDNIELLTHARHLEIESRVIRGPRINTRFPFNSAYDYVKRSARSTVYGVTIHKYNDEPHRQALLDVIGSYIVKNGYDDDEIMHRLQRSRQSPVYAEITDQTFIDDIAYLRGRLGIASPIVVQHDLKS